MSVQSPIQGLLTRLGVEQNSTPVAGANDTVVGTTNRYYTYFTMPTTASLFIITGFEWLNGTVVNGGVMAHLERLTGALSSGSPPSNNTTTLAWTALSTQTGVSQVQRQSTVTSHPVVGGTVVAASVVSNSATGRFGTTTVSAFNNLRATVLATAVAMGSSTSFTSGTEEPYVKVYYKAVL